MKTRILVSAIVPIMLAASAQADEQQQITFAFFQAGKTELSADILHRVPPGNNALPLLTDRETELTVLNEGGNEQKISLIDGVPTIRDIAEGWFTVIAQVGNDIAVFPIIVEFSNNEAASKGIPVPFISRGRDVGGAAMRTYLPEQPDSDTSRLQNVQYEATGRHDFQIRLTNDGSLLGQVIARSADGILELSANNNVLLVRDGRRLESTISDESGGFQFENLTPGEYGIVAAGPGGYTAFGFEAIAPGLAATQLRKLGFVIAQDENADGDVLPVVMVPPSALAKTKEVFEEGECPEEEEEEGPEPDSPQPSSPTTTPSFPSTPTPAARPIAGGSPGGVPSNPGLLPTAAIIVTGVAIGDDHSPPIASPALP